MKAAKLEEELASGNMDVKHVCAQLVKCDLLVRFEFMTKTLKNNTGGVFVF